MHTSSTPKPEKNTPNFEPYAIFDYSQLPFIKVDFTEAELTEENFTAYLDEVYTLYLKSDYKPVTVLIDMKNASYISSKYRIITGNRLKEEQENIKKYVVATAILTRNVIQNIVLKGIFVLAEFPSPLKIFSKEEEAIKWLEKMIEERKEEM